MAGVKHQGLHANRLTKAADNPREVAFAEEWDKENSSSFHNQPTLDHLLGIASGVRDRAVAATVIQWLGSNVGMSFLRNSLARFGMEIVEKERDKKRERLSGLIIDCLRETVKCHRCPSCSSAAESLLRSIELSKVKIGDPPWQE